MKLKYPVVVEDTPGVQQLLVRKNNSDLEQPTNESQIIAIMSSVALVLSVLYMYYTSRSKLQFTLKNGSNSYTFSEAAEHSEKIGSIIFIILFLALLQCLFTIQNFNRYNFERASLVAVNYIVVLGLVLLFYIRSNKYLGHGFVAVILTITIVYTSSMVNVLYHRFYTDDSLQSLNIISYIILAFFCFLIVVFILFAVSRFSGRYYVIVHHILAISELSLLGLYAIFICYFGQLPKLMSDDELSCVIKK